MCIYRECGVHFCMNKKKGVGSATASKYGGDCRKKVMEENKVVEAVQEEIPSMDDMKEALEKSYRTVRPGDVVTGTVISVDETEAVLDLDYFAPGKIAVADFSDDPAFSMVNSVKVGDQVTATVVRTDDGSGCLQLSAKKANEERAWKHFGEMLESGEAVEVTVKEAVKGGVVTFVEGVRGFIPASKLSLSYVEDLSVFVGQKLSVQVITVEQEKKKLVLSARELLMEAKKQEKKNRVLQFTPDSVVQGVVEQLMPYGAFVKLGDGISGLVHISQISNKRLQHPKEKLTEGQEVTVKVLKVENGKISLTMKDIDGPVEVEATEKEEAPRTYKDKGGATTSLADLFKNIQL